MTRRILLYSHDTFGLGHLRRTLKLAHTLVADPDTSCLVVTGSACPFLLQSSPGLDFVKLPSVIKTGPESYDARALKIGSSEILKLRSRLILTSVEAFEPHAIVVDNVPRGMLGELEPTLDAIATGAINSRLVLTMRDVLDSPEVIQRLWSEHRVYDLLEQVYDEILVFGSRDLFDVCEEYRFPTSVAERTTFCGYVGPGIVAEPPDSPAKLLFTVGGGGDGAPLAWQFLKACAHLPEELRSPTRMVLGPDMSASDRDAVYEAARAMPAMHVVDFLPDFTAHLAAASAVVCMGGYNTLSEVVALGRRALVAPRRYPRMEQSIRADILGSLGLVDVLDSTDAGPEALAAQIRNLLFAPPPPVPGDALSFDGLSRAAARLTATEYGTTSSHRQNWSSSHV